MFFLTFLATEIVDGKYPGGADASDPVPESVMQYASPWGYGAFALIIFLALLFVVTRVKVDR